MNASLGTESEFALLVARSSLHTSLTFWNVSTHFWSKLNDSYDVQVRIDMQNSRWVSSLMCGVTCQSPEKMHFPLTALGFKKSAWIICSDSVFLNGVKVSTVPAAGALNALLPEGGSEREGLHRVVLVPGTGGSSNAGEQNDCTCSRRKKCLQNGVWET
jgi:hypothetical protein